MARRRPKWQMSFMQYNTVMMTKIIKKYKKEKKVPRGVTNTGNYNYCLTIVCHCQPVKLSVEVKVTFNHQILTSSSLSPSEHLCKVWRNSLKEFLRCRLHENRTTCWQTKNMTPEGTAVAWRHTSSIHLFTFLWPLQMMSHVLSSLLIYKQCSQL